MSFKLLLFNKISLFLTGYLAILVHAGKLINLLFPSGAVTLVKELGEGTFGKTYITADHPPTVVKMNKYFKEEENKLRAKRKWDPSEEIPILKKLNEFLEETTVGGKTAIKIKFHRGYKLNQYIESDLIKDIMQLELFRNAVIQELRKLHSLGIAHLDIHNDNVLFELLQDKDETGQIINTHVKATLIDYGLAKDLHCVPSSCADENTLKFFEYDYGFLKNMMIAATAYWKKIHGSIEEEDNNILEFINSLPKQHFGYHHIDVSAFLIAADMLDSERTKTDQYKTRHSLKQKQNTNQHHPALLKHEGKTSLSFFSKNFAQRNSNNKVDSSDLEDFMVGMTKRKGIKTQLEQQDKGHFSEKKRPLSRYKSDQRDLELSKLFHHWEISGPLNKKFKKIAEDQRVSSNQKVPTELEALNSDFLLNFDLGQL